MDIPTPSGWENKYKYRAKMLLASSPTLLNLFDGISHSCDLVKGHFDSYKKTLQDQRALESQIKALGLSPIDATGFGSGYGYADDIQEFKTTLGYYNEVMHQDEYPFSESPEMRKHIVETVSDILSKKEPCTFLNFGVSYAHIDGLLAKQFPHVHFVGIDRSRLTKTFNEIQFGNQFNMKFVAGDIIEYLRANRFDGGVLFTSRTLVLLPESFVRKIYHAAYDAGFGYAASFEQVGISRQTNEPYTSVLCDKNSVVFRQGMYLHNYPDIMTDAGFEVQKANLIKTDHPHPDLRIFEVVGKRKD